MRSSLAVRTAAFLAPLACSMPLQSQGAVRTMSKPEVEFRDPFTQLTAVRELRDGRVVVADFREKLIQLVDLKAQKATKIGRGFGARRVWPAHGIGRIAR